MDFLMTRIAIEATGCDEGFNTVLEGAKKALERNKNLELILVAGNDKLPENYSVSKNIYLEFTDRTFEFKDKSTWRRSSILKAITMHKAKKVEAVIAPGDTTGAVIFSSKILKRIPGVLKPVIPANFPYKNVLIDVGANPECDPEHLFQFAIMGKVYSQTYLGVEAPLVGVVNVGEEDYKGPDFAKETMELIKKLKEHGYNISEKFFEGTSFEDLDGGLVVVTNAYTGNFGLKIAEIALKLPYKVLIKKIREQNFLRRQVSYFGLFVARATMNKPIREIIKSFDYKKYATCPLLGVNGNVMICHGRSDAEAIKNAILTTENYLKCNINSKLEEELARCCPENFAENIFKRQNL